MFGLNYGLAVVTGGMLGNLDEPTRRASPSRPVTREPKREKRVAPYGETRAHAEALTVEAVRAKRDAVEAARKAFKILEANYLREREEVYQSYLTELRR